MSDPGAVIPAEARPRLPAGRAADRERGTGLGAGRARAGVQGGRDRVEIIKRCTGEATFGEIIDEFAKTYQSAPRERILADIIGLLQSLGGQAAAGRRRWLARAMAAAPHAA